jgi:hypothetical protein
MTYANLPCGSDSKQIAPQVGQRRKPDNSLIGSWTASNPTRLFTRSAPKGELDQQEALILLDILDCIRVDSNDRIGGSKILRDVLSHS